MEEKEVMAVQHVHVKYVEIDDRTLAGLMTFILAALLVAAFLWLRRPR